jgi:hypothetical protein
MASETDGVTACPITATTRGAALQEWSWEAALQRLSVIQQKMLAVDGLLGAPPASSVSTTAG